MKLQEELNSVESKLLNTSLGKVVKYYPFTPSHTPKPPSTWIYGLFCLSQVLTSFINTIYFYFWRTILKDSRFFRYLHTAVIVSGTMLVFGGNTHNDTSMSHGAKCFSSDFMAYDIGKFLKKLNKKKLKFWDIQKELSSEWLIYMLGILYQMLLNILQKNV